MAYKLKYVGWQVGISYQAPCREGLDRSYLSDLLLRAREAGMNFISFMMISHGLNDAMHDGYAWPVRNVSVRCYVDQNCLNAAPETEFLGDIIEQAGTLGFHVNLFMNGFWWNPNRVRLGYPDIRSVDQDAANEYYHHCSDNDDAWRLACDEVQDLLDQYPQSAVKSYGFEMIGQGGCTCPDTLRQYHAALNRAAALGEARLESGPDLFRLWQAMRQVQVLEQMVIAIKRVRPSIEVWHHGFMELGDHFGYRFSAYTYRKAGVAVAIPCIHTVTDEYRLRSVLKSSENFPLCLHIDTRDKPTRNYPIPLKTPDDILRMGEWVERNGRRNLVGAVFFNEAATSAENQDAVYRVVRRWSKRGLC
jgi:hypothetical protein